MMGRTLLILGITFLLFGCGFLELTVNFDARISPVVAICFFTSAWFLSQCFHLLGDEE